MSKLVHMACDWDTAEQDVLNPKEIFDVWLAKNGEHYRVNVVLNTGNMDNPISFNYKKHEDAVAKFNEIVTKMEGQSMMSTVTDDVKKFLSENRKTIYWIAILFLMDHFFFEGQFRTKLNDLVEKMINRVEKDLES